MRHIQSHASGVSLNVWLVWKFQFSVTLTKAFFSSTIRFNRHG